MLYLDRYERELIDTELSGLTTQAAIFSAALSEGAVLQDFSEGPVLAPSLADGMLRRLAEPAQIRAQLFSPEGLLVVDSRSRPGPGGPIAVESLSPPETHFDILQFIANAMSEVLRAREHYPPVPDTESDDAADYPEVQSALDGRASETVRSEPGGHGLVLSAAVPVRRYKQILGAVLVTTGSASLERQVSLVRTDILRLFLYGLVFTSLASLYLASTIARPVRELAQAAHDVRHGDGRKVAIPDFRARGDEIGELSVALTDMTGALWRRMDAIERFAADVAHEIKNPLSSLRSAVETASRVKDPDQLRRLMAIILDDVQRLDRLISDISDASRLDAEMSRLEKEPISLVGMLTALVDIHNATRDATAPRLTFRYGDECKPLDGLFVAGRETRLVQVFQNLIANAVSFSPPDGEIRLLAGRDGDDIVVSVEDEGPGIPAGKLEAIFDRFYSERPADEKFGTHSGLGLSISKQIVEAHGGSIKAENILGGNGQVVGARLTVRLPAEQD
jgi:two-component system sensor histidine kinase ChvG